MQPFIAESGATLLIAISRALPSAKTRLNLRQPIFSADVGFLTCLIDVLCGWLKAPIELIQFDRKMHRSLTPDQGCSARIAAFDELSPGDRMQRLSVLLLSFLLAACAGLPPQLALVSQAADGVSYVFTGKSGTDHIFSKAVKKDCALSRAAVGGAICKENIKNSGLAEAQSRVEGGHPGAALDRPIGDDEIVALDPVLPPRKMAGRAPAAIPKRGGGTARPLHAPETRPAAFADPKPPVSAPVLTALVLRSGGPGSRPGNPKPVSATASQGEKAPKGDAAKPQVAPPKAASPKAPQPKEARTPRADPSYYVVVGTYRNWVTAIENAGRQSQGVASVVTARKKGGKTHRVLLGPFDHGDASDTRRLVGEEGYGSAWLVRSCAGSGASGSGARDPAAGSSARACMDLGKTWR